MENNGMYSRYARDLSSKLFNSVYDDLNELATRQQKDIYLKHGRKGYYVGECQEKFKEFTSNKLSLGDALDFIKSQKIQVAA